MHDSPATAASLHSKQAQAARNIDSTWGGSRQLNRALRRIATIQVRVHPAARDYLERNNDSRVVVEGGGGYR